MNKRYRGFWSPLEFQLCLYTVSVLVQNNVFIFFLHNWRTREQTNCSHQPIFLSDFYLKFRLCHAQSLNFNILLLQIQHHSFQCTVAVLKCITLKKTLISEESQLHASWHQHRCFQKTLPCKNDTSLLLIYSSF